MLLTIDGTEYKLPASLLEVTLGQRIAYDNTHGKALRQQLKAALENPEGLPREMALLEYQTDLATKTLSFFAGIPLAKVLATHADDVLLIYSQLMKDFSSDVNYADESFDLVHRFAWKGDVWVVAAPELENGDKMTVAEFVHAMQATKNLIELGEEKWEHLLLLCCIYFRKEGEPYSKDLDQEGGKRYELLKNLPLDYALHVGFFLNATLDSYLKTFRSSNLPAAKAA